MYPHGCQSLLMSCCQRTAPDANFEASDSIVKGFSGSGINKMGVSENFRLSASKASWHLVVHSKG
jgi:hypothetical protein